MPAFGIGALLFALFQLVVAGVVSRTVSPRNWTSRLVVWIATVVAGLLAAIVLGSVLLVGLLEVLVLGAYYVGTTGLGSGTRQ